MYNLNKKSHIFNCITSRNCVNISILKIISISVNSRRPCHIIAFYQLFTFYRWDRFTNEENLNCTHTRSNHSELLIILKEKDFFFIQMYQFA